MELSEDVITCPLTAYEVSGVLALDAAIITVSYLLSPMSADQGQLRLLVHTAEARLLAQRILDTVGALERNAVPGTGLPKH